MPPTRQTKTKTNDARLIWPGLIWTKPFARQATGLSPPVKCSNAVLLLWIIHVISGVWLLSFRLRLFIVALWSPAG